jgi:DNA-binding transcriptional LysR family regulator
MFLSFQKIPKDLLQNFPLLLIHRIKGEGIYERILKEFQRHDVEPNILVECPDVNILLTLITEGIGGSILPKSSVPPILLKEVQVLDIIDIPLQSETVLVYLKERYLSKAAQRFIELF